MFCLLAVYNNHTSFLKRLKMTTKSKRGGLREPAGGRPTKGYVRLVCYVPPAILEQIDASKGQQTRGDVVAQLVKRLLPDQQEKAL